LFRVLKSEVEELGELEKERDMFYELRSCEMKDFRENVEKFVVECRMRVEELRSRIKEVKN
jgi:archaellum component FlaC